MEGLRPVSLNHLLAGVGAAALGYAGFYHLNDWLFDIVQVSEHINWIFLPAAIRMLAVLLLGWAGVVGLFIGSVSVIFPMLTSDPAQALSLGILSSVPSLLAMKTVQHLLGMRSDLAGMKGSDLICFGLAGGLFNSASHTLYFMASAASLEPGWGFLPMFVGDAVGTLILLYAGAVILRRMRLPAP